MLRLLLDEQPSRNWQDSSLPACRRGDLQHAVWESGKYLGLPDEDILAAAREEGWTLVTFDQRTIAPLLKSWADQGHVHVAWYHDQRTFARTILADCSGPSKPSGNAQGMLEWANRVVYLTLNLWHSVPPVPPLTSLTYLFSPSLPVFAAMP